ncbi:MAG: hypothetical protein E6Q76_05750 [Rhizobium sp.]|nr:MAG: hypothetical protein E6Q76_05750 [Rhizobium sp.]
MLKKLTTAQRWRAAALWLVLMSSFGTGWLVHNEHTWVQLALFYGWMTIAVPLIVYCHWRDSKASAIEAELRKAQKSAAASKNA